MNPQPGHSKALPEAPADAPSDKRHSRWLAVARTAFLAVALLALAVFVTGVPDLYSTSLQLSVDATVRENLAQLGLSPQFHAAYLFVLTLLLAMVCFAVATVIFWRRSDELIALFVALLLVLLGATFAGDIEASGPLRSIGEWLSSVFESFSLVTLFLFFYLFPDGRFVPHWIRWLALLFVTPVVTTALFPLSSLNPDNWPGPLYAVFFSVWLLTGIFAQVYRYRRISGLTQRQQTKWVAFGFSVALALYLGTTALGVAFPSLERGSLVYFIASTAVWCGFLFIPASIGVAILRYRLWDIDIIINRTLIYGSLSAVLAAVFAITDTLLLPLLVQSILGEDDPTLNAVVSAVIIAVLFEPLRRRIKAGVNRLTDWLAGDGRTSESPR